MAPMKPEKVGDAPVPTPHCGSTLTALDRRHSTGAEIPPTSQKEDPRHLEDLCGEIHPKGSPWH